MVTAAFSAKKAFAGVVAIILVNYLGPVSAKTRCTCTPLWHCLARAAAPTGSCASPPAAAVPQTYVQCCPRTSPAPPEISVTAASASTKAVRFEAEPSTRSPVSSQELVPLRESDQTLDDNSWTQCGRRGQPSLIPGTAAPHEWPWHAAILEEPEDRYVCGASLISATWLLSAAHCVVDYLGAATSAPLKARLGELDVRTETESPYPMQERRIAQMLPHPGFDARTLRHDAALLRLAAPAVAAPNVGAVCLPSPSTDNDSSSGEIAEDEDEDAECYVTGWGRKDEASTHSQVLKSVRVPLWRRRKCDAALKPLLGSGYHLPEAALCAGAEGRDACDGDGGGPLVCRRGSRWAQVGIVSFGIGCGRRNSPGVYTSVTRLARWVATMTGAVLPTQSSTAGITASTARSFPPEVIDERPSEATTARTTPRPPFPVQVISYGRENSNGFRSLHVPDADDRARQPVFVVRYGSPRNGFQVEEEVDEPSSQEPFDRTTVSEVLTTTKQPVVFLPTVYRQQTSETSATAPNDLDTLVSSSPLNALLSSPLPASRSLSDKQRRPDDRGRGRTSNSRAPNSRRWEVEQFQVSTSTYKPVTSTYANKNDTNSTVNRSEPLNWGYGVVINHPPSQKNATTERPASSSTSSTASSSIGEAANITSSTTTTVAHPPSVVAARPSLASNLSSSYSVYRIYPSTTRLSGSRKVTPPPVRPPSQVAPISDDRQTRRGGKIINVLEIEPRPTVTATGSRSNDEIPTTMTTTTTPISSSSSSTFKNGPQVATTYRVNTDEGTSSVDVTTAGTGASESSTMDNSNVETTTTGYIGTPAGQSDQTKSTPRERPVIIDRPTSPQGGVWVTSRSPLLPTPVVISSTTSTSKPTSAVIARGGRRYGSSRTRISWQTDSDSWTPGNNQQVTQSGVRHAFHPGLRKLPADEEPEYDELQEAAPPSQHIVRSRPRSRPPPPAAVAVPVQGDEISRSNRPRSRSRTWNQNIGGTSQRSSRRNNRVERIQEAFVSSSPDPLTRSRGSIDTWPNGLPLSTVIPSSFPPPAGSSSRPKDDDDVVAARLLSSRLSKTPGSTTPTAVSEDEILNNRPKNEQSSVLRNLSDENLDEADVYAYLNAGRGNGASRRRTTAATSSSPSSPSRRTRTRNWDAPA